jgi:hypothetical protein
MTDAPTLDTLLTEFMFPARVWSLIERRGLVTLRDAVALAPDDLRAEKNVGRTSIADLRAVIESVTGTSWEEARAAQRAPLPAADPVADDDADPAWVRLRKRLGDAQRAVALADVRGLPTRMRSFAAARGITTVGALLDVPVDVLRGAPNLGRKSLADALEVLAPLLTAAPETVLSPQPPALADYPDLAALWRALLGGLDRIDRIILQHRSGLGTPVATLADIGEMLGVTRERVRQLEVRGLRAIGARSWWVEALDARLSAQLVEGAVALDVLAARDPWLAAIEREPWVFAFIEDRFLDNRHRVVRIDARDFLARFSQESFDQAWASLDEALAARAWPAARDEVSAAVRAAGEGVGAVATEALRARVDARLVEDPGDPSRALGYGGTRHREILGWLRATGRSVTVAELTANFGRGRWPEGIVYVDRGVVTVPDLLDGFDAVAPRVVARCVAHMTRHGAERQWSCAELAAVLRDDEGLPAWFGPWPLAALLRRGDGLRYLGRGVVVLPQVEGERVHLRALLTGVLEAHGAPMPSSTLRERASARRAVAELAFAMLLQRPPFVEVAPDRIGLLARDVPGGVEAARRATDALVATLDARGCGMSLVEALRRLRASEPVYAAWTESMLRSVCLQDARLQTTAARAVGLSDWESLRMPTRREVFAQALADGGGRAAVAVVLSKIEALYGESMPRSGVAVTAWHVGARLEGDELVARYVDARALKPTRILADVPESASARFEALLEDDLLPEDLGVAVRAHVRRFFVDAVSNDAIDLSQVIEAQRLCEALAALNS